MHKTTMAPKSGGLFRLASLPQAAAAVLALGASGAAMAQVGNPANGMTLYNQKLQPIMGALFNCADCHGAAAVNRVTWGTTEDAIFNRINGAINGVGAMDGFRGWTAAQRRDVAAYVATSGVTPPPPPPAGTPPVPTATPDSIDFGTTAVGSMSATQTVTVRNVSTTANVSLTPTAWLTNAGGDAAQFRLATPPAAGECANGTTLAPNATCSFRVFYSPGISGTHRGNFAVNFANGVSQRLIVLQGATSAQAQTLLVSPGAVTFTSTAVGVTSAPTLVMLTNQSAAAMTFAPQLVLPGGTNPGDFVQMTPASGTPCAAGGNLAAGTTCTIAFGFRPAAAGSRSATWSVQFAGAPSRAVSLQGTATGGSNPPAPAPAPADGGGATAPTILASLFALALAGSRRRRRGE